MTLLSIAALLGCALLLFVCIALLALRATVRTGAELMVAATEAQLELFAEYAGKGGATDPALIERLESVERRVAAAVTDVEKFYRKTAQERRRIEDAAGDGEETPELTPADLQRSLSLGSAGAGPTPNGRKLRPRGLTRR